MADCCEDKTCELTVLRDRHRRVLIAVFIINSAMFATEAAAGWWAHSTSLLADSLDMFGDALVYAFSLYVLTRGPRGQACAALAKGLIMLGFGLGVLAEAGWKLVQPVMPGIEVMGAIGFLALAANTLCFLLLWRHRADNLNLRSTWLCSRNDLFANAGVLLAAAAVFLLQSRWPDFIVGAAIAALFLKSAVGVLWDAVSHLRTVPATQ
jgi:cation diffusion facilitator family transporter